MSTYITLPYCYNIGTSTSTSTPIITSSTSTNSIRIVSSSNYTVIPNDIIASGNIISNDINYEELCKLYGVDVNNKIIKVQNGWVVETPDKTIIKIDNNGNIKIEDANAKVIYKASRFREFNKYINASDLLEEFIRFVGTLNIRQSEVLNIPIELFINWLILKAAEQDGEDVSKLTYLPKKLKRCLYCGKFVKKTTYEIAKFCNPNHYQLFLNRQI